MSDGTIILEESAAAAPCLARIGGGELFAFTARAPDKATVNEDTAAAIPCGPDACVLVIADGAGGLPAGKRASATAVAELSRSIESAIDQTTWLRTAILNGIEAANAAVRAGVSGSATTLTVISVEGRLVRSYQVGDSEALIVGQRGRIRLQTLAHSPTGFAVEAGFLNQREALHHEERHIVSNFVGYDDMRIDVGSTIRLNPLDTILLASDGLTDNLHLDEVIERMRCGPLADAGSSLVSLATRRMGDTDTEMPSKPDDLSVLLFRKPVGKPDAAKLAVEATETGGA